MLTMLIPNSSSFKPFRPLGHTGFVSHQNARSPQMGAAMQQPFRQLGHTGFM